KRFSQDATIGGHDDGAKWPVAANTRCVGPHKSLTQPVAVGGIERLLIIRRQLADMDVGLEESGLHRGLVFAWNRGHMTQLPKGAACIGIALAQCTGRASTASQT